MSDTERNMRSVRSFVRRSGRITASQQRALEMEWPRFGLDFQSSPADFAAIFGRRAPIVLEIGFGNGESLVKAALDHPQLNFVGVEVHEPGVGHCLIAAAAAGVSNLRVVAHDAMEVLHAQIEDNDLSRINLLFADPWPKKRHHKRRIVNPDFLDLAATKLSRGGALYIATDWSNYAEHIDALMETRTDFALDERREHDGSQPLDRHTTKFESRGLKLGHRIWDWRFVRE